MADLVFSTFDSLMIYVSNLKFRKINPFSQHKRIYYMVGTRYETILNVSHRCKYNLKYMR